MFQAVDVIWTLVAAALVFFMQAGFAMVETGFTRAKNAGNIIMKNIMDFAIGSLVFWVLGFGIMFGASQAGIIGLPGFFATGDGVNPALPGPVFLMFQTVFCATAATIVSGAMAERTKFIAYCLYSIVISAVIYPVSGHWIWGGGWLSKLGFHDFAGSSAVHMVGGIAALVGAALLGPRIGKYDKNGRPKAIPGHSLTLGALGVFILWFGWFGFNPGSTVSATGDATLISMGSIFITTNLAAAAAATVAMIITWVRYRKPDVSMTLNGALGGLVAITAGCDAVSPAGAVAIGSIAAVVIVFGIEFIDKVLKIDDPVGAIGVHGLCGAAGTILVGIFAVDGGLLYGGGLGYVGVQILGVLAVAVWVTVAMLIVFTIIKKTVGLRVSREEEISGLDLEEHGLVSSYADFMPMTITSEDGETSISMAAAVPTIYKKSEQILVSDVKMTKIEIITKQNKFDALKVALNDIGISGMTVSNVLGCGMQRGSMEYYRGIEMEIRLLPKVRVEIVVCRIPVETVIEAAKRVLYTGKIGDGKIFVYDVENAVKVRTGEEGYDALQDEE